MTAMVVGETSSSEEEGVAWQPREDVEGGGGKGPPQGWYGVLFQMDGWGLDNNDGTIMASSKEKQQHKPINGLGVQLFSNQK